jgi:hypothetical protein
VEKWRGAARPPTAESIPGIGWLTILRSCLIAHLQQREEQVFLLLPLTIVALTGLAVVALIVVTEQLGMRLYLIGSAAWRRVLVPVAGPLTMGVLLYRYFPNARAAAFLRLRQHYLHETASFPSAPYWASSSARRRLWRAVFRSAERGHPFRLERESPRF